MGGLLGAYALTGDELYKEKALQLGYRLLPAFDSPTGIPYGYINLFTGVCMEPVCMELEFRLKKLNPLCLGTSESGSLRCSRGIRDVAPGIRVFIGNHGNSNFQGKS